MSVNCLKYGCRGLERSHQEKVKTQNIVRMRAILEVERVDAQACSEAAQCLSRAPLSVQDTIEKQHKLGALQK